MLRPNVSAVEPQPITQLLRAVERGHADAMNSVFSLLYDDLLRIAKAKLRPHQHNPLVDATTVLHESYLRLAHVNGVFLIDRRHFLAYASRVMRSVIVDLARTAHAARRGGDSVHITLVTSDRAVMVEGEVLDVHEALVQLELVAPRLVKVVEARYFVGLSEQETGDLLGVTSRTVRRDMDKAKLLIAEILRNE